MKARGLEEAALECCSRKLFGLLRGIRTWKPRQNMRLLDGNGIPAGSDFEERSLAREHFQVKLNGASSEVGRC